MKKETLDFAKNAFEIEAKVIKDTGEGMDHRKVERINSNDLDFIGYGLSNIKRRIEVYYGKNYGFTVESEIGCGTTVKMRIPYNK